MDVRLIQWRSGGYVTVVSLSMSLQSALQQLASFRANNSRESQETFAKGLVVLKAGKTANLGEEGETLGY